MTKYHKIQTVWLRDPETKFKTLLEGAWAKPEFGFLAECDWTLTEKVDGTNIRLMRDGLEVRGKPDAAQMYPGMREAGEIITHSTEFAKLPEGMILYGEGYGEKIQKGGGNYRDDQGFVLFDVWCNVWLERADVEGIALALGIDAVPVVTEAPLAVMVDWCRSGSLVSRWGNFPAEGLVARPQVELLDRHGARVITKLKCKDFRPVAVTS